jgi:SAM-dependent methyltransferase
MASHAASPGVDYDHSENVHTLSGAVAALSSLLGGQTPDGPLPESLLDVGCGTGTWLRAALDLGVADVFGVDGVNVAPDRFYAPKSLYRQIDFTKPFDLGRGFDVVLCLEVAEHLPANAAEAFVTSLAKHGDLILFSAAIPNQPGQHHVNCQWPEYWQAIFNRAGYACEDSLRWRIWRDTRIEPWYRQNVFRAQKDAAAGTEPRIEAVLHPDMWPHMDHGAVRPPIRALLHKVASFARASAGQQ